MWVSHECRREEEKAESSYTPSDRVSARLVAQSNSRDVPRPTSTALFFAVRVRVYYVARRTTYVVPLTGKRRGKGNGRGQNEDERERDAKMRLEEDLVIRRSRPTMISAKYRAREERRRLLKISAGKLRRIEDPEASLCRSVLINNAVRRLQRENRDEKTRNYGLPIVSYLDDSSKENNVSGNHMDTDSSSKKRLGDEMRSNESPSPKRQRHEDLDLQDDVFSDFYILPPTPRLLSHIDDVNDQQSPHTMNNFHEDRLGSIDARDVTSSTCTSNVGGLYCSQDLVDASQLDRTSDVNLMDVSDEADRICDFARFADSAKTLEERLVELQSLDEHFDLAKFERNNNQSCGRAFHDIQTFHSLVPGLET